MKRNLILSAGLLLSGILSSYAVGITVEMNTTSPTMTLIDTASGNSVEVGSPASRKYSFEVDPGVYELTGYATDGKTVNGTIQLSVTDQQNQEFKVFTCTAYATNKNADNTTWQPDADYTLELDLSTREGERIKSVPGVSTTAGRLTFLALNGNSYYASLVPSEAHREEGYMELFKSGTLTFGVTVSGVIPMGADYSISLPKDAELAVGIKFSHFTDFRYVEPKNTTVDGDVKTLTYYLASGQVYNYRTWIKDGLTQAGYFTMNSDPEKRPEISFSKDSYLAFSPEKINHSVSSNLGYETGNIFVNINPQGFLKLNVGDTFDAHAMRTWELTDNSTNNYFIEPDFHYLITDLDGNPSEGVIEIDNADTSLSAWSTIRAIGKGTVIVRVIYDAIGLNYYNGTTKTPYLGGEYWGAIWPENTAVYVVSVGENESSVIPNMTLNERYNAGNLKMAGEYVDAEHDVFYYINGEAGARYTFTPSNAAEVLLAHPQIGPRALSYSGFSSTDVDKNEDGSYTLTLTDGRNIVCLKDNEGNATYQVLTAKPCEMVIENSVRPGSNIYQPGDKVNIKFSGLQHPANKLAGIYNMSAYVTYNDIPNGSSLILSPNQYTFGSSASAQTVTVDIPADYNTDNDNVMSMTDGVIQVNGYGDPIGAHRLISPLLGRSPNFTAVAHKTYFGQLPDVNIPVTAYRDFNIEVKGLKDDSKFTISFNGTELTEGDNGLFSGTYGNYLLTASTPGYRCYRNIFNITDDAEGLQTFTCSLVKSSPDAWDGTSLSEPELADDTYLISTGNELAWFANHVNNGNITACGTLTADIDLADYEWTPIGGTTLAKAFKGKFDGNGHTVSGLYIGNSTTNYQGLFGYVSDSAISNLTVDGHVEGKQYIGGIVAYLGTNAVIDRCVNNAEVVATGNYVGGIAGNSMATATITNSINYADVKGNKYTAGILGYAQAKVMNCYSTAEITGDGVGACLNGGTTTVKDGQTENVFCIREYIFTTGQTLVSESEMASGEVAYMLGEAFGQLIGVDPYPVIGGEKVYLLEDGTYSNIPTEVNEIAAEREHLLIYGIDGSHRRQLCSGINIIIYPDGTTRKVMIK